MSSWTCLLYTSLEADVNYKVAKDFCAKVSERAMGQEVMESLTPAQQAVSYTHLDVYKRQDQGAVVAAEWSENFADLLALENPIRVNIERLDDTLSLIHI